LALGSAASTIFLAAVACHIVGAVWLLLARPNTLGGWPLAGLQLALGAPSLLFAIVVTAEIAKEGDVAWMGLPFAIGPAALIWTVVGAALIRGPRESEQG
jgi:hypothetical protein